jgi:hypothetical protein
LVSFVDGGHAPFADWLHDAVLAKSLAYKVIHNYLLGWQKLIHTHRCISMPTG